jgi:hypothetical protein
MKTKLIPFSLLASATLAHAHLINLTPGGWNMNNGLPPGFERTLRPNTFFDEATPKWLGQSLRADQRWHLLLYRPFLAITQRDHSPSPVGFYHQP